MTILYAILSALAWLGAGLSAAVLMRREQFTSAFRWWHVVFWPALLIGWVLTLIGFRMVG